MIARIVATKKKGQTLLFFVLIFAFFLSCNFRLLRFVQNVFVLAKLDGFSMQPTSAQGDNLT